VDAFCTKAVDAGAKLIRPIEDQFYGDRSGALQDPFGHIWNVSTHIEDVPEEEMMRRYKGMTGQTT
jgi:PhnB protein